MSPLQSIASVRVSRLVIDATQSHLRQMGSKGFEGFVLWVGRAQGEVFDVTVAAVPQQRAVRSDRGTYVTVEADELHRLNVWLFTHQLVLLGQVHSHPGEAYHSETDDAYPVATTVGCYSLVVPDFAVRPFSFDRCAVYKLNLRGDWDEVPDAAVRRVFSIVE